MKRLEDYIVDEFAIDHRRWRIDWLGAVTFAERFRRTSQPLLEVQLSCVPDDVLAIGDIFARAEGTAPETRQVKLPVAFLPFLKIGDLWQEGRLVESPPYETAEFTGLAVDRSTSSIVKAGLRDADCGDYYLSWHHHHFHMRHTQSYGVLVTHGSAKIFVPAAELVRFYFGSAGSLVARLFDAPLDDANLWKTATPAEKGRRPKIELAPGLPGRSASTVARIAFSRSARHAAELIGKSCIAASVNGERVYLKSVFPFEGATDLVASGRWLPFNGAERGVFLVFKLLSCSHPFPFLALDFSTVRKNLPGANTTSDASGRNPQWLPRSPEPKKIIDAEPDKHKKQRDVGLDPLERQQFPDLGKKRVAQIDQDPGSSVRVIENRSSPPNGASAGEDGTDAAIRPIDLVGTDEASSLSKARNEELPPTVAAFLELVGALAADGHFSSVEMVRIDQHQRHDYVGSFPKLVDSFGTTPPWCLATDAGGAVRCREVSIACARGAECSYFIVVPEPASPGSAGSLELHVIADFAEAIAPATALITILTAHFSYPHTTAVRAKIAPTIESIQFKLQVPEANAQSSRPIHLVAKELLLDFVEQTDLMVGLRRRLHFIPEAESVPLVG